MNFLLEIVFHVIGDSYISSSAFLLSYPWKLRFNRLGPRDWAEISTFTVYDGVALTIAPFGFEEKSKGRGLELMNWHTVRIISILEGSDRARPSKYSFQYL
jgi:hypothetical protein